MATAAYDKDYPMKKFLLAGAAVAALATGAQAADLGSPRAPIAAAVMAPAFSWTGFYLGAHAGYGWAQARYTDFSGTFGPGSINANGFFGGIQGGYNWQMNSFVFGIEADVAAGALNRTFALGGGDTYRASVPFLSTVRARAGFAADRALFYVTGGLGIATFQDRVFDASVPATFTTSSTRAGYALGAGVEYAFTPNWTAKVEYMYYGFGDRRNVFTANDRIRTDIHTVKLGINYLFSTGPSAVVARY
jgi:outer membrane immunogenic protein